jgi:hypothetical protein
MVLNLKTAKALALPYPVDRREHSEAGDRNRMTPTA